MVEKVKLGRTTWVWIGIPECKHGLADIVDDDTGSFMHADPDVTLVGGTPLDRAIDGVDMAMDIAKAIKHSLDEGLFSEPKMVDYKWVEHTRPPLLKNIPHYIAKFMLNITKPLCRVHVWLDRKVYGYSCDDDSSY